MSKHRLNSNGPSAAALAEMASKAAVINPRNNEAPTRDPSKPAAPHCFDGIQARGHWLIAEIMRTEDTTGTGAIVVPESSQRPILQVVTVGELVTGVEVGDIILYGGGGGAPPVTVVDGRSFVIIMQGKEPPYEQVCAVLDKANVRNRPEPPAPKLEIVS